MTLPPLSEFLTPTPGYPLETPLGEVALALAKVSAPDRYVIVVDDRRQPVGAIALTALVTIWAMPETASPLGASYPQRLMDCSPWLLPVMPIRVNQTLGAVLPLVRTSGTVPLVPVPLVLVDEENQYLGVASPEAMLSWLANQVYDGSTQSTGLAPRISALEGKESSGATEWSGAPAPPTLTQNQAWVLELSHALKTPMTSLLGLSTLLLDPRVGALSDRQNRYVHLMHQALRKLMELINQLLDWLRLESGQLIVELGRIDLRAFVQDLDPSFWSQEEASQPYPNQPHRFTLNLGEGDFQAKGDRLRLQQSLNYIFEYWRHQGLEPGGLSLDRWGPWLGLTLWPQASVRSGEPGGADRPVWLEPEHLSVEGLGLALARRFSQLQGGELTFWPGFSHSPHMTLLLPPVAPSSEPGEEPSSTTVLVLLACDRPALIEQVQGCLQNSRYRLILARSTPDLVTLWVQLNPAYVILHPDSLPESLTSIPATLLAAGSLTQILCLENEPTAALEGAIVRVRIDQISSHLRKILDQLWPFSAPSSAQADLEEMTLLLLHMLTDRATSPPPPTLSLGLRAWLQHYRCRLLQVDDLEQARVLSRVWQPSAIVLEGELTLDFVQTLAQCPTLVKHHLIALNSPPEVKAAAAELGIVICPQVLQAPPHLGAMALIQAVRAESPAAS